MGLDFDVLEFCKKLRQNRPPPYQCPLEKCDKVYKSLCGLQYHLVNYDHDNPTPATPAVAHNRKKGWRSRPAVPTGDIALQSPPKEALTFAEAQKAVQFEIDGKISRISIDQPLPLISLEEWEKKNAALEKPVPFVEPAPEPHVKLPEASFKLIPDYNERVCDAPPRPNAYIRFIEKSAEELDGEVEYDVDEEDTAWLGLINKMRAKTGLQPVSVDTLELLMDRLEKESYFQASQTGQQTQATVDEDAVCCICMDGECQNTNVILFCDMCNLAVHQDCYGVPYIPEGQWLCRRCLQSPSRLVSCALCPNTGGAFKQTDQSTWAHVVCALWIPEVRFANTVFLEPIDSIEMIPPARWKLQCMVCKQRGAGACIQCHKSNCYSAFHVTCAQQAGLYMKMEAAGAGRDPSQPVQVAKMAYCDAHTPAHILQERKALESEGDTKPNDLTLIRQKGRDKIKQARRVLALKRTWSPVVLVPTLPAERVSEIATLLGGGATCRAPLMSKLLAYWTLKRHSRNGVPLLRRLQSATTSHGTRGIQDGTVNVRELCNQLKYWQRIRQDLERARLLCELVRKRERVKAEATRVWERCLMHSLRPARAVLHKLLRLLRARDRADIFTEPVDPQEVPDYSTVVTHPMDLSTMSKKLDRGAYKTIDDMEADFTLMINNCLAYNNKDTVFYKAGIKMREQCLPLFRAARRDVTAAGMAPLAGSGDCARASPERDEPRALSRTRERSVDSRASRRDQSRERESMESDRTFDGHLERALSLARSERDDRRARTRDPSPRRGRTRERSASSGRASPSRGRASPSRGRASPNRGRASLSRSRASPSRSRASPSSSRASPARGRTREPSPRRGRTREASPRRGSAKRGRTREPSRRLTPEPSPRRGRTREPSSARGRTPEPSPRRGRTREPSPRRGRTRDPSPRRGRTREPSPRRGRTREPSRGNRETSPEPSQSQDSEDDGDTNSNTQEDAPAKPRKPNPWWSRGRGRGRRGRGRGRGRAGRPPAARERDNETATSGSETPAPPPRADRTVKLGTPELSPRGNKSPRSPKKTPDNKTGLGLLGGLRKPTLLLTPPLSSTTAKGFGADASLPTLSASLGADTKKKRRGRPPKKDKDKKSEGSTDLFRLMSGEDKPVSTPVPASFLQYRGPAGEAGSDSDLALSRSSSSSTLWSQSCSSCTHYDDDRSEQSCSLSSSDGSSRRGSPAGEGRGARGRRRGSSDEGAAPATPQKGRGTRSSASKTPVKSTLPDIELEPLQLVWAKCRGYPWYPALIIDPKMPRGFIYNGVPLPVPPPEVMSLKKNHAHEPVLYLVLFFDVKRTWQWLPPAKLELLGVEKSVDQSKLVESRKPADRKAVKKAYADAMQFRKQVDGDEDK